jgi:hypothetical protein
MKVPAPHSEKQSKTIAIFVSKFTDYFQVYRRLSTRSVSQAPQVSKAVNSGRMPICPPRLQCVTAYQIEAGQLKTFVGVAHLWAREIAKHVGFATAGSTRAGASERFELDKGFCAVLPGNGKLVSYLLNVSWLQAHSDQSTII